MKTLFQKHQILESLNDLDQAQTEEVLRYIQRLVNVKKTRHHYHMTTKGEAMNQIRSALTRQKSIGL